MEQKYIFYGTVESCNKDESHQSATLCFICEKVRDEQTGEEHQMPHDRMPMAATLPLYTSAPERNQILSLRKEDKIELHVHRYQNNHAMYSVKNLTMKQKYIDVKAFMGGQAGDMFSQEPHSLADKIGYPAVFPEVKKNDDAEGGGGVPRHNGGVRAEG